MFALVTSIQLSDTVVSQKSNYPLLWIVHLSPIQSILISFWGLNLFERAHIAQLSIANRKFPLSSYKGHGTWEHTIYTKCKLHSCIMVYTPTRCLVLIPLCIHATICTAERHYSKLCNAYWYLKCRPGHPNSVANKNHCIVIIFVTWSDNCWFDLVQDGHGDDIAHADWYCPNTQYNAPWGLVRSSDRFPSGKTSYIYSNSKWDVALNNL